MPSEPVHVTNGNSGQLINIDSTANIPPPVTFGPINPDTSQKVTVAAPPPLGRPDTLKPKKSRGVIGITDNDYRIVPVQKDSTGGG